MLSACLVAVPALSRVDPVMTSGPTSSSTVWSTGAGSAGGGGTLNVIDGDLTKAQQVIDAATKGVAVQRGRLGAFQKNVVGSTINSLNVALENISAAESTIRDADFAKETADLTRYQVLQAAATNVLSIANSQPQNALRLLG